MKKEYRVEVYKESWGFLSVMANSKEEAKKLFKNNEEDEEYINKTDYQVDFDDIDEIESGQ